MVALLKFAAAAVSAFAMSAWAHAASHPKIQPAAVDTLKPRLTVLYDAFGKVSDMQKDWGYSALVEVGGKRILFDTGNDPAIFANNVKATSIDLTTIDFVVMSHRHGDHMGGLSYVLAVNPNVKIYAPKESFGIYGSSLPSSFYRRAEALPVDMRYFDGAPPEVMTFGSAWPGANFELIDKSTEIAPGIHLIALISDKPGTLELKELSLAVDTPEGVVLIVGCSHPGIARIVDAATTINKRVHMIVGGLHLVVAQDAEIANVVASLHDAYGVAWVAPGHCTGEPTFAALQQAFGDRYLYAGLGTVIGLGANPRAGLDASRKFAMSAEDLSDYRRIMRRNLVSFGRRLERTSSLPMSPMGRTGSDLVPYRPSGSDRCSVRSAPSRSLDAACRRDSRGRFVRRGAALVVVFNGVIRHSPLRMQAAGTHREGTRIRDLQAPAMVAPTTPPTVAK